MGYGEFGGTGSVNWKVTHDENGVKKQKGKDKDEHSGTTGGMFTVVVNGLVIARVPIDPNNSRQVLVIWPPDSLATIS
jgi:hypothetical protein